MSVRPARLRRSSLAVPGGTEKMLAKAAASSADQIVCDLEDAVAVSEKIGARQTVIAALHELDWGGKVRSVRVNDVATEWCYEDIISLIERAGEKIDTIILPKVMDVSDVLFADKLISQIERKLNKTTRIGLEVLIEDVGAIQNVDAIAACSDRIESLIFGTGDYSASQGVPLKPDQGISVYPADLFYYVRSRLTIAARAAGIDAIDGPSAEFRDLDRYSEECAYAANLGMAGKWAIHPAQIEGALAAFTPHQKAVDRAREIVSAFEAAGEDAGVIAHNGVMIDAALIRMSQILLSKAEQIGM